jgi:hypothetical protein
MNKGRKRLHILSGVPDSDFKKGNRFLPHIEDKQQYIWTLENPLSSTTAMPSG